jgi:uncharacterized protein (TIGR00369 family)
MGCMHSLPEGMAGFTTIELKSNFLRSAEVGATLACDATLQHRGRTTQVWDARVDRDDGRPLALFRCTQHLLVAPRDHAGPETTSAGRCGCPASPSRS